MERFSKINENIYRLCTPYKDIYTTMYIIKTDCGVMIFDTASCDEDMENALIPALKELGIGLSEVKAVFISHKHRDHAGGLARLMPVLPSATIYSRSPKIPEEYGQYPILSPEDGDMLLGVLQAVTIPGHTLDSCAILDTRTNTLITGDCMQVFGIFGSGDWGCNITYIPEHFEALEKVRKMDIAEVYTAHDYHPIGYKFIGKDVINKAIDGCVEPLLRIRDMMVNNPDKDDSEIREMYNASGNLPTVSLGVVRALRTACEEGRI